MIVLDINAVSELMRPTPDGSVLAWVDRYPSTELWLTSRTVAELCAGIAVLPTGARRRRIGEQVTTMLSDLFADRILPFDAATAPAYADVLQRRERQGRPISIADVIVAGTCLAAGADLHATRNITDFTDVGLPLTNPWGASAL